MVDLSHRDFTFNGCRFESYLEHDYPYENREIVKGGQFNVRFDERYSKEKWSITINELKNIFERLPDKEKNNAIIWGKHYAQAGAVNLFNERSDLPKAFSLHGSFYNWVPKGEMPVTTICLGYNVGGFFNEYSEEVIKVKTIYNPYSENEEELHQHIYICKKPKLELQQITGLSVKLGC